MASIVKCVVMTSTPLDADPWPLRLARVTVLPSQGAVAPAGSVQFSTTGGKAVTERIEVTFDSLADPVRCAGEMTYVTPRTIYSFTRTYE